MDPTACGRRNDESFHAHRCPAILAAVAQPMRSASDDDERRARELAASREYAERSANNPVLNQRIAEWNAAMAAGEIDEANLIHFEELVDRIRRDHRSRG
jgi:hypothetical protein